MHRMVPVLITLCVLLAGLPAVHVEAAEPLTVFCGAALKKPVEDAAALYQKKTGVPVTVTFGGVGTLFSQILLSRQGDVFVVPSPDIMEKAMSKKVVRAGTVRNIAYMAPCINVQKGNPLKVEGVRDLARPGLKVGIANPEIVYTGAVSVEILDKSLSVREKALVKKNIVTYAEDFNKLATMLLLKQVDAIMSMHFLEGWYPDKVTTVRLKAQEIQRVGAAQAAVIGYSTRKDEAERFVTFLSSAEVQDIFRKYHYFGAPAEAFAWVGATKPIGGEFSTTKDWSAR